MPPKKLPTHPKAIQAADRRAEQEAEKARLKAIEDERKEAEEWSIGSNARGAAKRKVYNNLLLDIKLNNYF